jgi:hypothetical protein
MLKSIKIFSVILILVATFIACETPIYFNEPQPSNGQELKQFPQTLLGRYQSATQSGRFLIVKKNKIISEWFWTTHLTRQEIDTLESYEWRGNALYHYNERQQYTEKGDSIIINGKGSEVTFEISKESVLKSHQGHFFLNEQFDGGWEVRKMYWNAESSRLLISKIRTKSELESLRTVTALDSVMLDDTSQQVRYYKVNPTESEFEDIANGSFFTVEDVYTKISN